MAQSLPVVTRLTKEQQLMALKMFVPDYALGERKAGVAGGQDWVPHEWVTHALDVIFGPENWSTRMSNVVPMTAPDGEMYIYVPIELTVTFADGTKATRCDVGVGFVRFTKIAKERNADDLSDTPLDNFSTGYKSAVTSGLKGCARDLGRIFIPMQNQKVSAAIHMEALERELDRKFLPTPSKEEMDKQAAKNKVALGRDNGDLLPAPNGDTPGPSLAELALYDLPQNANGDPAICKMHGDTRMAQHSETGAYYHKLPDGSYCNGAVIKPPKKVAA